ncbi:MAG: hypothetical protein K0R88_2131 [Solirubrobacterales bacterium]|jgi:hypothetical protein|nr:hypothetical protein [Solirubrobacterales bacterium]
MSWVGTAPPRKLRGTTRDDVIAARGKDDTVTALGGDDVICGAGGDDRPPSVQQRLSSHSTSGLSAATNAPTSARLVASTIRRTISSASSDIAYTDSPAAFEGLSAFS